MVHSGIKMTGRYFIDFGWDENYCNSLHKYKDYPNTQSLTTICTDDKLHHHYKVLPNGIVTACRTAHTWRKRMAQWCSVNRQHHVFFYVKSLGISGMGRYEIRVQGSAVIDNSFHNKFEWTLAPMVSRPSEGRAGRDTVGTGYQMPCKVWNEVTYPFPNFKGFTCYDGCNYLSMLRIKLIDVSRRGYGTISHIRMFPSPPLALE